MAQTKKAMTAMAKDEVTHHISTIEDARRSIEDLRRRIGRSYGKLASAAALVYAYAPEVRGCGAESRKMRIHFQLPCSASPLGVCVYNPDLEPLPCLRGEKGSYSGCIFCGVFHDEAAPECPNSRNGNPRRSTLLGA